VILYSDHSTTYSTAKYLIPLKFEEPELDGSMVESELRWIYASIVSNITYLKLMSVKLVSKENLDINR
jgi:hypothetical protein